jgi:hypothetical protein
MDMGRMDNGGLVESSLHRLRCPRLMFLADSELQKERAQKKAAV